MDGLFNDLKLSYQDKPISYSNGNESIDSYMSLTARKYKIVKISKNFRYEY